MSILIAAISILVITAFWGAASRILPFKICPICAGVSITWLWMLIGMLSGYLSAAGYQLSTAILMGGSVVGVTYQIEKRLALTKALADEPTNKLFFWKLIFIPLGFAAVYYSVSSRWLISAVLLATLFIIALIFIRARRMQAKQINKSVEELKKRMRDCC